MARPLDSTARTKRSNPRVWPSQTSNGVKSCTQLHRSKSERIVTADGSNRLLDGLVVSIHTKSR